MSKGTYRVGLDFNPSGSDTVTQIKELAASLIDMIEDIPNNDIPERGRLKALAQTHVEDAAMWAVKAATKKPQEDELALARSMDDPNPQTRQAQAGQPDPTADPYQDAYQEPLDDPNFQHLVEEPKEA
jgi:hypothetical protein